MNRAWIGLGVLLVVAAVGWALWETTPPARPPAVAPASVAAAEPRPSPAEDPARAVAPPEAPPPRRPAVTTAIEAPPAAALNPPIPHDQAGVRRMVALRAPPPPGVGDGMSPRNPAPEPGAVRREAVREAVLQAKPAIADCYRQTLERDAEAKGTLKVQFKLVAEGGVAHLKDAEITEDSLGDPFLGMCALKAIAAVTFKAETDGEVLVNYPFILQPEDEESDP